MLLLAVLAGSVPGPAVGQEQATVSIFRLAPDGASATRTTVRFGRSSVNAVEVVDGLAAGDRVEAPQVIPETEEERRRYEEEGKRREYRLQLKGRAAARTEPTRPPEAL